MSGWALVTGGSRGIGRAVSVHLAALGWDIAFVYLRNEDAAREVTGLVRQHGRQVLAMKANLGSAPECGAVIEQLAARTDALGGLVHAAGLGALSPVMQTRPNRWQLAWDTHVGALVELVARGRPLLQPGASVVALSSQGAHHVLPGYASIAAAKAALESLVRYLAVELAPFDVNVNAVSGGPVDTDSLRSFASFDTLVQESARRPCGRLGQPQDLAGIVAFLMSPEARWIRGQVIVADGGFGLV
jgi:enoyl-[acyl-carrier protein] reductase III